MATLTYIVEQVLLSRRSFSEVLLLVRFYGN